MLNTIQRDTDPLAAELSARHPLPPLRAITLACALAVSACAGAPLPAGFDPDQREACVISFTHACGREECLAYGKRYAWAAIQELEQ